MGFLPTYILFVLSLDNPVVKVLPEDSAPGATAPGGLLRRESFLLPGLLAFGSQSRVPRVIPSHVT